MLGISHNFYAKDKCVRIKEKGVNLIMTIMIPNHCVDGNPIARALYDNLSMQLDDGDRVVESLISKKGFSGSLFWVQHQRRSLFIYLADSSDSLSVHSQEKSSSASLKHSLKSTLISQITSLQKSLLPESLEEHCSKLVPFLVINPYAEKIKNNYFGVKSLGLFFAGKGLVKSNMLGRLVYKLLGIASSESLYQSIRYVFNPELRLKPLVVGDKSQSLLIDNQLLDESQELAMKMNLVLPQKIQESHCCLTAVSGCVVSGKTEVLIQRVKLIKKLRPKSKIIIITINYVTQSSLKERYAIASTDDAMIEIVAFNEWCKQILKPVEHLVEDVELASIIEMQLKKHLDANDISSSVFLSELDFIYGQKIFYEKDYLSAQNAKRLYALSVNQLKQIWRATLILNNYLSEKNYLLSAKVPQLLWDKLQRGQGQANYDYVLVDDAGLLPPIAVDIFKKVVKPEIGQVFMTQNANQVSVLDQLKETEQLGFCRKNIFLDKNYGANPVIVNAMKAFLLERMPDSNNACQAIMFDEKKTKEEMSQCPYPQLLHFHSLKDEQNRLLNEVKKCIHDGVDLQEILIICAENTVNQLKKLLREALDVSVNGLDDVYFKSQTKRVGLGICSFSQVQGLTASHVYIFGLEYFFEKEKNLKEIGGAEYLPVKNENSYLIARAMGVARMNLTLFLAFEEIPQAFVSNFIKNPTNDRENDGVKFTGISYLAVSG